MKVCKTCHGKGWIFAKSSIFTGKTTYFGLPVIKYGDVKLICGKCFGKGIL
jgi:hypothetical protein